MTDLTQTEVTFISHQALTHPNRIEGTPAASASWLSGAIYVRVASVEAIANVTGVMVWIMGSYKTSGDDAWVILVKFRGSTTVPETESLSGGGEPQGETTIVAASTTNLVVEDDIYIQDASVVADGEFHVIEKVVSNTSILIDMGLAVAKDDSDFIWTEADNFVLSFPDMGGLQRVNVIVVHEAATGSNLHILAEGVFATDIE